MATTTKTATPAKKATPAAKKAAPAVAKTSPAPKAAEVPKAAETPAPKSSRTYRDVDGFMDLMKATRKVCKDPEFKAPLQLITHLAWKTPGGSVGWSKGTTESVMDYADDVLAGPGTAIPAAMDIALKVLVKTAKSDEEKAAVKALGDMITAHHTA